MLDVAERQFGLFTQAQASLAGYGRHAIARRVRLGRWSIVHPGMYRLSGVPVSRDQTYLAAVLRGGPHALLGGEPAGFKWGLDACRPLRPHIITTRNLRGGDISVLRRARPLSPLDHAVVDSIPMTSPTRTVIDLASLVSPARLHSPQGTKGHRVAPEPPRRSPRQDDAAELVGARVHNSAARGGV